jgi:hypothetical protein
MTFQKLLFGVGFFTVLSLLAWVGVFFFVDPDAYGMLGIMLFLGTLFSFLTGAFTLSLVNIARRALGNTGAEVAFGIFFRQGFLLSLFCVALLFLSWFQVLSWWNAGLVLAGVLLVELSVRAIGDKSNDE